MKFTTTVLFLPILLASCSTNSPDSFALSRAKELRAAADKGDPEATIALADYLSEYAPEPGKLEHICEGKHVSPFAAKKLSAQGQDCRSFESAENKEKVEKWRSVGLKPDALVWYFKAAEYGDPAAIGIRCAIEKDPPKWLKKDCDWLEGN
jgi:hypothetical protein